MGNNLVFSQSESLIFKPPAKNLVFVSPQCIRVSELNGLKKIILKLYYKAQYKTKWTTWGWANSHIIPGCWSSALWRTLSNKSFSVCVQPPFYKMCLCTMYQFVCLIFQKENLKVHLCPPHPLSESAAWPEDFPLETETISQQHWLHSEDTVQPL